MFFIFLFLFQLKDTIIPERWYYLGPFLIAPREGISGIKEEDFYFGIDTTKKFPSVLTQGGYTNWRCAIPDKEGNVKFSFDNVFWDTLIQFYGFSVILNLTYAYTEIEMEEDKIMLVMAERVGSFLVNGRGYLGDVYGHNFFRIPVKFKKGKNSILLKVSGYGERNFKFIILEPKNDIIFIKEDITKPDILKEKEKINLILGIPFLNITEEKIDFKLKFYLKDEILKEENRFLMPFAITKFPIELRIDKEKINFDDSILYISLVIETQKEIQKDSFKIYITSETLPHSVTFISQIDSSCQYFAISYPKNFDRNKKYGLIYSLHGAGVEAIGLCKVYSKKDFAFIACPTNRRSFGFDWEDWGYLDCKEVLEYIIKNYPIDTNRIYLTGHSMGGHGCWVLGLLNPSLFAAIAPGAGWISHQSYVPWLFQRSLIYADPEMIALRDKILKTYQTIYYLENAHSLPIFIFHGALDDNVPTLFGRMFNMEAERLNLKKIYKEVPNVKHWYNLPDTNIVCVDDPDIINFFKEKEREVFPKKIIFKTYDLDISNKSYWIEILKEEEFGEEIKISCEIKKETIFINTNNIEILKIYLVPELKDNEKIYILIDKEIIKTSPFSPIYLLKNKKWQIKRELKLERRNLRTMKKAYFSPFILVYSTKSETAYKITYSQALREGYIWYRYGNGYCQILPDTLINQEIIKNYNLIIFGDENYNYLAERLRIKKIKNKILKDLKGDFAYRFIYFNPLNKDKFILVSSGTNLENLFLSTYFSLLSSAVGMPDYIIFDSKVRERGLGGVIKMGFFK
ncbi:MAG: prolyl oligopeptidase family serine peptidase [candidate division WOR-3 bacterium]|nr:prolyl oligopeptidase family serine peptidase [candidate division WOR-3 bacterium]MCX7837289.1 prolyl oligopeptidase family serine peptidase [candidate division WOR-3 bacterium]MDW8113948.1 prolyl oligopeptidase family serine peptidase [candidate division WOR-3 bacterium]